MIERQGTISGIEWLEDEAKKKAQNNTLEKLLKTELKLENEKWVAIADMYKSIEEVNKGFCYIGIAIGKVQICFNLKYISKNEYTKLMNYLMNKEAIYE